MKVKFEILERILMIMIKIFYLCGVCVLISCWYSIGECFIMFFKVFVREIMKMVGNKNEMFY